MRKEVINLYNNTEYNYNVNIGFMPKLHGYIHDETCPSIIICPGGAYMNLSPLEAEPVALKLYEEGYNTYVLCYTTKCLSGEPVKKQPLNDLTKAIHIVKELTHDGDIYLMGFSAGANLVGTFLESENSDIKKAILCYPLVNVEPENNILPYPMLDAMIIGGDEEIHSMLNLDEYTDKITCDLFVWTTKEDDLVPYKQSLMLKEACDKHNVNCELKVFETGKHGLSLANETIANCELNDMYTFEQFALDVKYLKENKELHKPFDTLDFNNDLYEELAKLLHVHKDETKCNAEVSTWVNLVIEFLKK